MASATDTLTLFHHGIPVPEYDVLIPWMISEPELFALIPRSAFSISAAEWPMLPFSLLGVTALFGFNFVTHPASRFIEVQLCYDSEASIRHTFESTARLLLKQLGPSQSQNPDCMYWSDDRVKIENSIYRVRDAADNEGQHYKFSIFATFWIPPEKKLKCGANDRGSSRGN